MRLEMLLGAVLSGVALVAAPGIAEACGCLALPSPATNVVQAGERILFTKDGDNVVAYIQVQYTGNADNFAWLVPLPSVPTVEVGTDELFQRLGTTTLPRYSLSTTRQFCDGGSTTTKSSGFGCGSDFAAQPNFQVSDLGAGASDLGSFGDAGALVERSSVGPYDFAVLKADDQTEMLKWLNDNRFFVPAGTDAAMKPYIHPGAYFLALKLKAGESTGDIVPIIVRYKSDLPMIPIILTQVGAVPDMGVQVWVLGKFRATPRNYHHTVIDDLPVWFANESYNKVLIRAAKEAPKRHSFITEYAGTSAVMSNQLAPPGRFGTLAALKLQTDPEAFLDYLKANNYRFDSTMLAILLRQLPMPDELVTGGVSPLSYYTQYAVYQLQLKKDGGANATPPPFDALATADEIDMRIVVPTRKTQALFDQHPYLTRLYTALSPEDMTADPVFSENPDLPNVALEHAATVTIPCKGLNYITTDQGFESQYPKLVSLPASERIEVLREAGPPELVIDNRESIKTALGPVDRGEDRLTPSTSTRTTCGCSMQDGTPDYASAFLMLAALALIAPRRRWSAMRRR